MGARADERIGFEDKVRIRLLETDMDQTESDVSSIKLLVTKLTWAVVGAALSLTTASLLLAVNIVLQNGA